MKRQLVVMLFAVAIIGCGSETNITPPASPTAAPEPTQEARWLKRDSDAEELLQLLGYDQTQTFVFNYEGGILFATIYQTDGQVLYSGEAKGLYFDARESHGDSKLSDVHGRLLVMTSGSDVHVVESLTFGNGTGVRTGLRKLKLDPDQLDQRRVSVRVFSDFGRIMFGDSLFMELRWLEQEVDLDGETKNRIWWEVERSRDEITKREDTLILEFNFSVARIAKGYGITYEQARAIFDEGKTAAWRTETPPE